MVLLLEIVSYYQETIIITITTNGNKKSFSFVERK